MCTFCGAATDEYKAFAQCPEGSYNSLEKWQGRIGRVHASFFTQQRRGELSFACSTTPQCVEEREKVIKRAILASCERRGGVERKEAHLRDPAIPRSAH